MSETAVSKRNEVINNNWQNSRNKGCPLSVPGAPKIDYKNPDMLKNYTSERGRILPKRIISLSAKKQRELKRAIKIARILSLLPFAQN